MLRQPIAFPMPVPNALETASFAAKMKKSIAKPINGMLNASALDKINTDADDTHLEFELCGGEAGSGVAVRPKSQPSQT